MYGLKVSTGLLSRSGIPPSSTTFDSPGILAKSAWDIAALLTDIDGVDPDDPVTADSKPFLKNFTASLNASWTDFRIGAADRRWFWSILPGFVGDQADIDDEEKVELATLLVHRRWLTNIADVLAGSWSRRGNGATRGHHCSGREDSKCFPFSKLRPDTDGKNYTYLPPFIHVSRPLYCGLLTKHGLGHEMGPGFAKYAASLEGVQIRTLEELIDFNRKHPELSYAKGEFIRAFFYPAPDADPVC